jgi:hypothetical protein
MSKPTRTARSRVSSKAGNRLPKKAITAGAGNPNWKRAIVTESKPLDWPLLPSLDKSDAIGRPASAPITLAAGPADLDADRVQVSLGESWVTEGNPTPLEFRIEFACPMYGRQRISAPITLGQAYSLEEAIRAVFSAARAKGLIPSSVEG